MTDSFTGLTPTDLIAAVSQALTTGGYLEIRERISGWDTPTSRLFEDVYNVVGVAVFDTCSELLRTWPDLQSSLVEVITGHVGHGEQKSWDGYLVLLTSGLAPSEDTEMETVRYNTQRLRKIVASGDDLRTPADVERVLRPLLPLGEERARLHEESALDILPRLLEAQGIPKETTQLLVDAFREQSPLLERLHQKRGGK
jgi:hypothetical protein